LPAAPERKFPDCRFVSKNPATCRDIDRCGAVGSDESMNALTQARRWGPNRRAGVLLDLFLASAIVILGAFALYALGNTFGGILRGVKHFFGF
jgi:hypothetical protein